MAAGWTNRDNRDDAGGSRKKKKEGAFSDPLEKAGAGARETAAPAIPAPAGTSGTGGAGTVPPTAGGYGLSAPEAPEFSYEGQPPVMEEPRGTTPFRYEGGVPDFDPRGDGALDLARQRVAALEGAAPAYEDPYGAELEDLYRAITGREDFRYDLEGDPLYQQYRALYLRQGRRAMEDSMGRAAALTGGYGSSYAQSAGQQQYDEALSQLNERAPELYDRAYQRWLEEGRDLEQRYDLARERDREAYDRYRDRQQDWRQDLGEARQAEDTAYRRAVDDYERQRDAEETAYQRAAAQWQRDRDGEDTAYQRARDSWERAARAEETAYNRAKDRYQREYSRYEDSAQRLRQLVKDGVLPQEALAEALGLPLREAEAAPAGTAAVKSGETPGRKKENAKAKLAAEARKRK